MRLRDTDVFEQFYKEYRPKLRNFVHSIVRDHHATDEVLNDTMMTVWNKINDFEGRSRLSTWIFTIAYRKALRARMKLNKADLIDEHREVPGCDPRAESIVGQNTIKNLISRALESLPDGQRSVVRLAYFDGMSYREISTILDCPVDTVKTRMFHARRKLKTILGGSMADWV